VEGKAFIERERKTIYMILFVVRSPVEFTRK